MKLPNEFRINHRAASESLLRAAEAETGCEEVLYELGKASYFENEAMTFVQTPRQKALAKALLHAVDMMQIATEAEFESKTSP